jgi:hypothetical protein
MLWISVNWRIRPLETECKTEKLTMRKQRNKHHQPGLNAVAIILLNIH